MRRIDIEIEGERLRIEFPYDRSLVQTVKTLPRRRFDPDRKVWYVPFDHVERVFETLLDHHFKISQELREYCREHHRPVGELIENGGEEISGPTPVPPDTLSISELNLRASEVLREAFDEEIWLVGELQSYDRTTDWRHAFFELVERPSEKADPMAKIQAVMFQNDREQIRETLREAPDEIRLRDGLAVRVRGEVELYPEKGAYQFVVRAIDPTYTAGKIQQNRQAILNRLEQEGIREQNRRREWPLCPLRVGLVTSYGSDAYSDFKEELEESGYGFELTVHDAYVQGSRTEESILRALSHFEREADEIDLVVIVRGGGARSDLAYFDTPAIGEAVCRHPLKIVCGIGHQRDVCLLDHVASSEKTPTAAAGALVERVRGFVDRIERALDGIVDGAETQVGESHQALERLSMALGRQVDGRLSDEQRRLSNLRSALSHGARDRLEEAGHRVEGAACGLERAAKTATERQEQRLTYLRRRLRPKQLERRVERERSKLGEFRDRLAAAVEARLEVGRERLDWLDERRRLLDPQGILDRGFAIVSDEQGVVRSAHQAPAGSELTVRLADGRFEVVVESEENR